MKIKMKGAIFFDHEIILSRGHSIDSVNHHPTETFVNSKHFGTFKSFQLFWNHILSTLNIILESKKIWKHTQLHHFITLSSPRKLESYQIIWDQIENYF